MLANLILLLLLFSIVLIFPLVRWTTIPITLFTLGVSANIVVWFFLILRPWLTRRISKREGPPVRGWVYLGIILLGGLISGTILFREFSKIPELRAPLTAHTDRINTVVYNPAADKLASAGADRIIRLWAFEPGGKKFIVEREFPAPNQAAYVLYLDQFTSVAYSPDGAFVVFGSMSGVIRIWDTRERRIVQQLSGHLAAVRQLQFSPDGRLLVSGSDDKTVRAWRLPGWESVKVPIAHAERVTSLAFTPDHQLVTGSADKTLRLWRVGDNESRKFPGEHTSPVLGIGFIHDNTDLILLAVNDKRVLRRWKFSDGVLLQELYQDKQDSITSVAFKRNGMAFASGDSDKVIRLWTTASTLPKTPAPTPVGATPTPIPSPRFLGEYSGHTAEITSLEFDPLGEKLVSGSKDGEIRIWEQSGAPAKQIIKEHTSRVTDANFSADGKSLVSASEDKTIRLWNALDGTEKDKFDGAAEEITHLAFTRAPDTLVSVSRDSFIRVWRMKDKESLLPHELSGTPYRITSLAAAPVDVTYWVATGNLNGEVRLWKPSDGTFLEIKEHGDAVTSLAYSPNGKVIATGSADSKVRLFHTADGKRIDRDNQTHQGKITDLVFSPDGKTLASLGLDNTVCLWQFTDASVLTPTKLISIPLSAKNPLKMAFSQDSKSIATAGYDAVIRVWNVEDGLPIAEAPARAQPVIALGINNDGWIVAASLINSSRSIQEWSSPMQLSEMRDPRSGFALTRLFVGNEYSQLFWAAFLGIAGVGSVILFLVAAYSAVAARTLYSQYKNFTFWEGWRAAISIELGLHKILQIVTKGEVQTTPAVGPLARFGGPGVLIVEEGHAAVLMASGRITRVVGNGITWLKPFERVQTAVYLPARMEKVVVKDVSTQDKMVLSEFSLLVFYKVDPGNRSQHSGQYDFDPDLIKEKIWSPSGGDHNRAVKSISENIVRDLVGQYNLEDIAAISGEARQTLIKDIVDHINIKTKGFLGIDVGGADLGAVVLSSSAKQALEEKMLAEVRRQTAVINAEAEREKMVREAEGTALKTRLVEQERAAIREHFIKQLREPLQSPTGEPLVSEETAQRYIGILVRFLDMFEAVLGPDELDRLFSIRGRSKS